MWEEVKRHERRLEQVEDGVRCVAKVLARIKEKTKEVRAGMLLA